ncbi:hypothetical protein PVK64_19755 [Aliivibrio sp. S4TY2]|uniref:hypothetical protein n=2 Tax=Aliivibrio TaxID=511678 RepID=UPI002378822F|nr:MULTISPECIES: hypothetical protein [unclassified Aliivibrio]MDD9158404.1 hypothetical protein [Aliivibrio sp. S4TY2]MDD9162404.1 hypothetical protein [Aliivibrio sp. S4TY1]MDD9170409.1 hypothetical protein [Aliivibrio sp. S4MY4]MDD9187481.1 hypothetical protein [Aliivibrio sp. S4MY3]MDD9204679.1 hypothetical protein [Aliivibrio sp. S4MY1]
MKSRNLRKLLCLVVFFTLTGCSSPGPMQTPLGPINTPVFDSIALATAKDGTSEVKFKTQNAMLYKNGDLSYFVTSVFFITENGVYVASWDTQSYQYNLIVRIPVENIKRVYYKTYVRDYLPDLDLLVIETIEKENIGFYIGGSSAVKSILDEMIPKS